jgi:hypothetical protein
MAAITHRPPTHRHCAVVPAQWLLALENAPADQNCKRCTALRQAAREIPQKDDARAVEALPGDKLSVLFGFAGHYICS